MKSVQSFLAWLSTVIVKTGDMHWNVRDRMDQQIDTHVRVGTTSSLELNAPGRGVLNIKGKLAVWQPDQGTAIRQELVSSSALDELKRGINSDFSVVAQRIVQLTHSDLRRELGWLAATSADVTILVIPGISAFGIKTPGLDLGSVVLPPMSGDLSLRNVAVDLAGGHVGFELRIHRAEAIPSGTLAIDMQKAELVASQPRFRLAADAIFSLKDATAAITLDWMEFETDKLSAVLPLTADRTAKLTADGVAATCRSIVSQIDLKTGVATVSSGSVALQLDRIRLSVNDVTLGPLRTKTMDATADQGVAATLIVERSIFRGMLGVPVARILASQAEILTLPVDGHADVDPTIPIDIDARGLEFSLPEFEMRGGSVNLDATLRQATIKLSGLNIDVQEPFKVRAEAACNASDRREGALLKVPRAVLTSPHFNGAINLLEAVAKRWSERPGAALAPPRAVLQARTIYELSILVEVPPYTVTAGRVVAVNPDQTGLAVEFFNFVLDKLGNVGGQMHNVVEAIGSLLDRTGAMLDKVKSLLRLTMLISIDEIRLLIGYKDVTVTLDPEKSGDNILVFRVSTGMTGIGGRYRVSWPAPHFDDIRNRDSQETEYFLHFDPDFPDLAVEVQFTYDAAAKKIVVERGRFYFAIGHGIAVEIEKRLQEVLMLYFGVGQFIDKIVDDIHARLPSGLPSQWDVTNLQIDKPASDKVKGIAINLRATETQFASL